MGSRNTSSSLPYDPVRDQTQNYTRSASMLPQIRPSPYTEDPMLPLTQPSPYVEDPVLPPTRPSSYIQDPVVTQAQLRPRYSAYVVNHNMTVGARPASRSPPPGEYPPLEQFCNTLVPDIQREMAELGHENRSQRYASDENKGKVVEKSDGELQEFAQDVKRLEERVIQVRNSLESRTAIICAEDVSNLGKEIETFRKRAKKLAEGLRNNCKHFTSAEVKWTNDEYNTAYQTLQKAISTYAGLQRLKVPNEDGKGRYRLNKMGAATFFQ